MTNPTPQPHADDVKLAEAIHSHIWPFVSYQDDTIRSLQVIITQVTKPLRLSNEALRERVKELEKMTGKLLSQSVEDGQRANAARKVIEKCERALKIHAPVVNPNQASYTYRESCYMQALAAIKEWKAGEIKPPAA